MRERKIVYKKPQSWNFNERLEARGRNFLPTGRNSVPRSVFKGMRAVAEKEISLEEGKTIEASTEMQQPPSPRDLLLRRHNSMQYRSVVGIHS